MSGKLKRGLLDDLWKHRFVDDSMAKNEFEEALIKRIHSIIDEASNDFPYQSKPELGSYMDALDVWKWFVEWFGEK